MSESQWPESALSGGIVGSGVIAADGATFKATTDGHVAAWTLADAEPTELGKWGKSVARWAALGGAEVAVDLKAPLVPLVKPCRLCADALRFTCDQCSGDGIWEHGCTACHESHTSECDCDGGISWCGCPAVAVSINGHVFDGRKLLRALSACPADVTRASFVLSKSGAMLRLRTDVGGLLLMHMRRPDGDESAYQSLTNKTLPVIADPGEHRITE